MYIKHLFNKANADVTNGGGGTGTTGQGTSKGDASGEGTTRASGDSRDDSSGSSNESGDGDSGGNILLRAVQDAERQDAEGKKHYTPPETKEPAKEEGADDEKETSKETTNQDDSEEDEFDESKLRNKNGAPISQETGKFISRLKAKNKELKAAAEDASKKAQLTEPTKTPEYEKLLSDYTELKTKHDEHFFEQSDAFKAAFVAPVAEASKKIAKFFTALEADDRKALSDTFEEAIAAAESDDKIAFYKAVDSISSDFMPDAGRSATAAFGREMDSFFEAIQKKAKAFADKGEGRKKIVEAELEQRRSKNIGSVDSVLDRHIRSFEVSKSGVLSGLKGKELEEYKSLYLKGSALVKKHLNDFAVTGSIPDELASIISDGVTAKAIEHEAKLAWVAYKSVKTNVDILKEENESLKKQLAKYTGGPGKSTGSFGNSSSRESSTKKTNGSSALADIVRQAG